MTDGTRHYFPDGEGGFTFRTERKVGEVRVPNYVFDLWLPLLGIEAIGVYTVYCRLERGDVVRKLSAEQIGFFCHLGKAKVLHINAMLEDCGFIRVRRPEGTERIKGYTSEVTILDPPEHLSAATIETWQRKNRDGKPIPYQVMADWLTQIETPSTVLSGTAGGSKQNHRQFQTEPSAVPNRTADGSIGNQRQFQIEPPLDESFAPSIFADSSSSSAPAEPAKPPAAPAPPAPPPVPTDEEWELRAEQFYQQVLGPHLWEYHRTDPSATARKNYLKTFENQLRRGQPLTAAALAEAVQRAIASWKAKRLTGTPKSPDPVLSELAAIINPHSENAHGTSDPAQGEPGHAGGPGGESRGRRGGREVHPARRHAGNDGAIQQWAADADQYAPPR